MRRFGTFLFAGLLALATAAAYASDTGKSGPMLDGTPWPTDAQGLPLRGTVIVQALVGADGTALKAEVAGSSGHPELDHAALAAVRRWRFKPPMRESKATQAYVKLPVVLDPTPAPAAPGPRRDAVR